MSCVVFFPQGKIVVSFCQLISLLPCCSHLQQDLKYQLDREPHASLQVLTIV